MDREQLIRSLRNTQDEEFRKFGDVGDRTHGKAADMLEDDDIAIRQYEEAVDGLRNEVKWMKRTHRKQLLILCALNSFSHLCFVAFGTWLLVKAKVWTWPLF